MSARVLNDEDLTLSTDTFDVVAFTDGCCYRNGKTDPVAGYGVCFKDSYKPSIADKLVGERQTANRAELTAIYRTLDVLQDEIKDGKKILICADSLYAINCSNKYGEKCSRMGWKRGGGREIPNSDIMQKVYAITSKTDNITFKFVKAHTRRKDIFSNGNREADRLAKLGAEGKTVGEEQNTIIDGVAVKDVESYIIEEEPEEQPSQTIKVVKRTKVSKKKTGECIIISGKHVGKTYDQVNTEDPRYIYFLMAQPVGTVLDLLDYIRYTIQ